MSIAEWFQAIASGEHARLHEYLSVSHNDDGTLNGGSLPSDGTTAAPSKLTGVPYFGPAAQDGSQLVVLDDTNAADGVIQWQNNATNSGEMIHLTGGPNMTGSGGSGPSLLAMGLNYGGVGLFINNYLKGVGLKITNRATINNASAWGFLLSQNSDVSEGMYLSQETTTAKTPLKIVNAPVGGAGSGQVLSSWWRSAAATADTLIGRVLADTGFLDWRADVTSTTKVTAPQLLATGTGANIELAETTGGTADKRRFKWSTTAGLLILSARTDADASAGDLLYIGHATKNLGVGGFNSMGSASGGAIGLPNSTAPSGTPSGGGVLYVESGALKYKGSSGTVTTLGAA